MCLLHEGVESLYRDIDRRVGCKGWGGSACWFELVVFDEVACMMEPYPSQEGAEDMGRIFNFNPGPAALPESVLRKVQEAIMELPGVGAGIAEISHRSPEFEEILAEMQAGMRRLFSLSDDVSILFCQGGARMQFAMLPMNFLQGACGYVDTGTWSDKAIDAAKLYGETRVVASSKESNYNYIPAWQDEWIKGDESYFHITSNNTIYGTQWATFPDTKGVPLVVDMSSDIASREVDFSAFDMVYAGAQKNLGPAGVTLVFIKSSFAEKAQAKHLPMMLRYKTYIDKNSLYNTPPVLSMYIVSLMVEWLEQEGGIAAIEAKNKAKAESLYAMIDANPSFFRGSAREDSRSMMNIHFNLPTTELEKQLVAEAKEAGFMGVKGHRSIGGIRVSNYNAVTEEGISAFVSFCGAFAKKHGE